MAAYEADAEVTAALGTESSAPEALLLAKLHEGYDVVLGQRADRKDAFLISGKGDVISSDEGLLSVGSGSMYALAAARALLKHTKLSAAEVAAGPARHRL